MLPPLTTKRNSASGPLRLFDRLARALGHDLLGILVQRPCLRNRFHGLLYLWVGFEQYLEPLLLSEAGHEHFLLDLPLDPLEALGHLGFRVTDVVLAQILAEGSHYVFVRLKIFIDRRLAAEIKARKPPHAGFGGEEHIIAVEQLFELRQLWRRHGNIRCDAASARHLASAIRQFHFRRMIGHFSFIVVFIERNRLVVPLNQPAARRVVPRGRQRQSSILAQRCHRLHEAFAKRRLAHNQSAIMVLHRAGNNFRRRCRIVVHQDHQRNGHALIAAQSEVPPLRRCPPMVRNDQLVLVQEHVANRDRLIQQAARFPAHVQDQAIQRGRIQLLQRFRNLAIRRLVKPRQPDIPYARFQHERDIHRMPRYLVARHRENELLRVTFARNRYLDDRAFRSLQHVRYFAGGQSIRGSFVDFDDHVARPDPRVIRWRSHVRRHHHCVILARRDHHAHAVILPALVLAEQGKLLGIEETRMRIEHAQHAWYGALIDGLIYVDRVGIVVLDYVQDSGKVPHGRLIIIRRSGRGPDVGAVNAPQYGGYQQHSYNNYKSATL